MSEVKDVMHPVINQLICDGFMLRVWDDRYSQGITVAIALEYDYKFNSVRELTDSADIEASGFSEYLNGLGNWLPFARANNVDEAIDCLERKLQELPEKQRSRSSNWFKAVENAYDAILRESNGGYGIANAIDNNILPDQPDNI